MTLFPTSAVWKYCLRDGKIALFRAKDPQQVRRWSLDEQAINTTAEQRFPPRRSVTPGDNLPPVATMELDFLYDSSDSSDADSVFSHVPRASTRIFRSSYIFARLGISKKPKIIKRDGGEFRIPLPSGNLQVFGDYSKIMAGRYSISNDQELREIEPKLPEVPFLLYPTNRQIKWVMSRYYVVQDRPRQTVGSP
jgi:hypothetical protein